MERTFWRGYVKPADRDHFIARHSSYNTFDNLVYGISLQQSCS